MNRDLAKRPSTARGPGAVAIWSGSFDRSSQLHPAEPDFAETVTRTAVDSRACNFNFRVVHLVHCASFVSAVTIFSLTGFSLSLSLRRCCSWQLVGIPRTSLSLDAGMVLSWLCKSPSVQVPRLVCAQEGLVLQGEG